jgi:DNA-binding NarL/FixJ family response regulator
MESKKNIILVDDHTIFRQAFQRLIEVSGRFVVFQTFANGLELINAMPFDPAPDLVILDINMKIMDGHEVMKWWSEKKISIPVLILTCNDDEQDIVQLFRSGVRGYLVKECDSETLHLALEEIFRCGYYHNEFLASSLRTNDAPQKKTEKEMVLEQLSAREKELLKHVCHEAEYTYKEMADLMGISGSAVDKYRDSLFVKFGIKSKTGLLLFVIKYKLFELLN